MTAIWVIGGSGLLGSALQRVLLRQSKNLFTPAQRFNWGDESELNSQLAAAVKAFSTFVDNGNDWQIYWAAGIGNFASSKDDLVTETRTLSTLLKLIESESGLVSSVGCFAFSSSAGAIYAGAKDDIISENTAVSPTTEYAKEKIKQENLLTNFGQRNGKVTVLLARISTLYGPGQADGKRQGLLAHIARCILRNKSVNIFVPLDTIRDYITADDAASMMVASLTILHGKFGVFTKIIASEKATTIAEIVSVFNRIARRRPRIVASASKLSSLYSRRIQFRSVTVAIDEQVSRTSLLVGVAQVLAAERSSFTRSHR
ncbi:hypothetical protein MNBD_GAMMA05-2479 [hydrothermal vent metagenome]|uniref:NAD-dependent epimerase/dehydratase domain-containing protein n=1 Tax=hydrothermal vent metagenome TaxID=652676 RepID=A0A3B0WHD7_9ZZZZ